MYIKLPVITEKTLKEYKNANKVAFEVLESANKIEASKELEKLYGVTVLDVKNTNRLGKTKYSRFSKSFEKTGNKKIMYFKLKKGDKIDFFEQ